jgi:hypothetical protein
MAVGPHIQFISTSNRVQSKWAQSISDPKPMDLPSPVPDLVGVMGFAHIWIIISRLV